MRPRAVDLFCGLGGWTDGLLAEGYDVTGYDIEEHVYGDQRYPARLVIQDVLALHGAQFKDAALIVASPPCQEFSYMAMPWSRAKQIARALRSEDDFPDGYTGSRTVAELTALFDACFRIQREASEAAGRHIPMVVENVRGAIPWVGRSHWNFGSFHLWGDVPALMPVRINGYKSKGMNWSDRTKRGQNFTRIAGRQAMEGTKIGGDWFSDPTSPCRLHGSKSMARKAASAMIAKIPLALSRHIAATFNPETEYETPRASPATASRAANWPGADAAMTARAPGFFLGE